MKNTHEQTSELDICLNCERSVPSEEMELVVSSNFPEGYFICKECHQHLMEAGDDTDECAICGKVLPMDDMHFIPTSQNREDGYYCCQECMDDTTGVEAYFEDVRSYETAYLF